MGTDNIIPLPFPITCECKKYLYQILVNIHLQYSSSTRCEFYIQIQIFLTHP